MSTIRVLLASASLLLSAGAEERLADENVLAVPAVEAPLLDGRIGGEEWARGTAFSAARGDEVYGTGRILRLGRDRRGSREPFGRVFRPDHLRHRT